MKTTKEMNEIEKIAYKNIKVIFNWEVGGWYNCIMDHCEEYIPDTIEEAKEIIYEESLNDASKPGWYGTGKAPREMRFAGAQFIREVIDHLFKKDEDEDVAEIAKVKGWVV